MPELTKVADAAEKMQVCYWAMTVLVFLSRSSAKSNHYYRVFFFTGPTQKSSKYGTGPPQYRKITKFTGDGKNPLVKK